jgi:hypothetical protein
MRDEANRSAAAQRIHANATDFTETKFWKKWGKDGG